MTLKNLSYLPIPINFSRTAFLNSDVARSIIICISVKAAWFSTTYINDLQNCSDLGKFEIFADDTNIFVCDNNREEVVKKANSVLTAVSSYMHANKLHINMKKCCYMHFKPKISTSNGGQENNYNNNNQHTRIRINDYEIDEVEETKFLGVTIDNKLNWLPHLKLLAKKLRCCSGQLNRIKHFLPTHLYKNLYHTLFESHLSYAISVWAMGWSIRN